MIICGMDEVGRGALAGPIVGAAVIFNSQFTIYKLNDSKKLTVKQRNKLYKQIIKSGAVIGVEMISVRSINIKGIGWANKEIFKRLKSKVPSDKYIADGNLKITGIKSIIKADNIIPEVMAASIIAKVFRDAYMTRLHTNYEIYNWKANKGYGTQQHLNALKTHGFCKHHRKLFVRNYLNEIT